MSGVCRTTLAKQWSVVKKSVFTGAPNGTKSALFVYIRPLSIDIIYIPEALKYSYHVYVSNSKVGIIHVLGVRRASGQKKVEPLPRLVGEGGGLVVCSEAFSKKQAP